MSQAINTFWVNRYDSCARVNPVAKHRVRARRVIDGVVIMVMLTAAGICLSVYNRSRAELNAALSKHAEMAERVSALSAQVERLERDVKQVQTDARVIESYARQRFGFVRSGEVVIKVGQDEKGRPDPEAVRARL